MVITKLVSVVVAVALAASNVAAQPVPGELPLTNFLEKRVPEELAAEGKILSRQNLALKVEQAGPVLIVSLVALDTGHVAASTKVDQVPPDREAAVASITHVAADLAGRPEISTDTKAVLDAQQRALDDERRAREADRQASQDRELAQLKYQKEMIRFTARYDVYVGKNSATVIRNWEPYRGELEEKLDPKDFYTLVGHAELAERYDQRQHIKIGGYVVGMAAAIGAIAVLFSAPSISSCSITDPAYSQCLEDVDRSRSQYLTGTLALGGVATIGMLVGVWYQMHPQPIEENEAKSLAAAYNEGLRRNYGLPIVKRPLLRDVRIAPYLASNEGGLSLGGRF